MLAFTYIFLIAMFPMFYEWMKSYEIAEAMAYIKASWNDDSATGTDLSNRVTKIAWKNKITLR